MRKSGGTIVEKRNTVIQLCEAVAREADLRKLNALILEISVLLEAEEQRLKDDRGADAHRN